MTVFVLKALKGSVPRPLSSFTLSQCFLLCRHWSLYSPLYLSSVMTLLTPIRAAVTHRKRSFPFKECLTLTSFSGIISHLCFHFLVFTKNYLFICLHLFLYFLSFLVSYPLTWLLCSQINLMGPQRWDGGWKHCVGIWLDQRGAGMCLSGRRQYPQNARTSTCCHCFHRKLKHGNCFSTPVQHSVLMSKCFSLE